MAQTDTERLTRIAANEARFRDINEQIEAGRDPADASTLVGFICECGSSSCERLVELTTTEYEQVRSNSRYFVLRAGHQAPDAEVVVETTDRYLVVAKRPETWPIVDESDPGRGD